jgi:hypothetical protein
MRIGRRATEAVARYRPAVRKDLAGTVQSALEPAHVWVWTRAPG